MNQDHRAWSADTSSHRAWWRHTCVTLAAWIAAASVGALLPALPAPAAQVSQAAKLFASDGEADDQYGESVAVAGDTAVVGARRNGFSKGAAYVLRFDGTSWVEEAKLTASDAAFGDQFGVAVSVAGDTAVVGARNSVAAYMFRYNGTTWVEEAKLTAPSAGFGSALAVAGDTAVVGAYGDNDNGSLSGSAYVFRYNGTTWVEEAKLTASDGVSGDFFGWSVAVAGDTIVVGASPEGSSSHFGAAYVFRGVEHHQLDVVRHDELIRTLGRGRRRHGRDRGLGG